MGSVYEVGSSQSVMQVPDLTESTNSYHFDSAALDTGCRPTKQSIEIIEGGGSASLFRQSPDQKTGSRPSRDKRIFNFLQVTLSNKSQSQEETKTPAAAQVLFGNLPARDTVIEEEIENTKRSEIKTTREISQTHKAEEVDQDSPP